MHYDISEDITEKVSNEWDLLDISSIDDAIATLKSLKMLGYESISFGVSGGECGCCYDSPDLFMEGYRNETPEEKKKRIARDKKDKETLKRKKEKEAIKQEQDEKALYLKLQKKYGK